MHVCLPHVGCCMSPAACVAMHVCRMQGCLGLLMYRHAMPCHPLLTAAAAVCLPRLPMCPVLSLYSAMQVGISCRKGGSYFNKRNKGFFQASCWQHKAAAEMGYPVAAAEPAGAAVACYIPPCTHACARPSPGWLPCCLIACCLTPCCIRLGRPPCRLTGPTCLLWRTPTIPQTTWAATATISAG
jgi:hypothetical protein